MSPDENNDDAASYPCVCCGYLVLEEGPNSHEICPICWWEDDVSQLRWPTSGGGANRPSLMEAQQYYAASGARSLVRTGRERPPLATERREAGLRPGDLAVDDVEAEGVQERPWPVDRETLYWWRGTLWRRSTPAPGLRSPHVSAAG